MCLLTHPQQLFSSHIDPQWISHPDASLTLRLWTTLEASGPISSICTPEEAISGWIVAECIPYACKHSFIVFAITLKWSRDGSAITMCADAKDFSSVKRQT
jgi:hypothetical protein